MTRAVLGLTLLVLAVPATAGMFSYRDKDGNIHFVDQETAIPPQYRGAGSSGTSSASPGRAGGGLNAVPAAGQAEPAASDVNSGPEEPAPNPDDHRGPGVRSCTLKYVDKPSKVIDPRYTTVTYRGEVENGGNGIARGARAHLKLFSAIDGSQVDDESAVLRPADVDPGERASFEITGNFQKNGLRNSSRDELMIDYVRCDPSERGEVPAASAQACRLQLVGAPQKVIDVIRKTVTYSGSVENQGTGVAKTVQVELTMFNMRDGKPFEPVFVTVTPSRVGPGESATFQIVAPQEFGFRDPNKDKFAVRASQCE